MSPGNLLCTHEELLELCYRLGTQLIPCADCTQSNGHFSYTGSFLLHEREEEEEEIYLFILMCFVRFHPRRNRKARRKGSAWSEIRSKTMEHLKQDMRHIIRVSSVNAKRQHSRRGLHGIRQQRWETWSDKKFCPFCSLGL